MRISVVNNIVQTLPVCELPAFLRVAAPIWQGAGQSSAAQRLQALLQGGEPDRALDYLRSPKAEALHRTLASRSSLLLQAPEAQLRWNQWAKVTLSPRKTREEPSESPWKKGFQFRRYQREMLAGLERDMEGNVSPWLGIASPMQTGKSALIGPMVHRVRRHFGKSVQVLVVTSSENTTDQIAGDLEVSLKGETIGRFDRNRREVNRATVASIYSLVRYLDLFPNDRPTVLIFDQASWTQTPIGRKIVRHFGMGEESLEEGRTRILPRPGSGLVIGLSNTGWGLEGYHVSGRLDLWNAIRDKWIRDLVGDRVIPKTTTQRVRGTAEEKMIWWRPTKENAKILADIYDEKIHGRRGKKKVYVPTIRHGELLTTELRKRHGEEAIRFVHSKMKEDFSGELARWHRDQSTLVSIRRVSVGTRASGVSAIFHTYQSSSMELFGERTGRGWAVDGENDLSPLFVLEACWDRRSNFANLARLLGLQEYPSHRLDTRENLEEVIKVEKEKGEMEGEIQKAIDSGEISPLFKRIPLVSAWRQRFRSFIDGGGGLAAVADKSGIPQEVLAGLALGALPTQRDELLYDPSTETYEDVLRLWTISWEEVVDGILEGRKKLDGRLEKKLMEWRRRTHESLSRRSGELDLILSSHYQRYRSALKKFHLNRKRLIAALRQAQRDEKAGKPSPEGLEKSAPEWRVCRRAELIYAAGLPADQKHLNETLEKRVFLYGWMSLFQSGGKFALDREMLEVMRDGGFGDDLGKHREKMLAAIAEAVVRLKPKIAAWKRGEGPSIRPTAIGIEAANIFMRNGNWFSEARIASDVRRRFRNIMSMRHAFVPEIALMMIDAGAVDSRQDSFVRLRVYL